MICNPITAQEAYCVKYIYMCVCIYLGFSFSDLAKNMDLHVWVLSDPTIAGCSANNPFLTDSFQNMLASDFISIKATLSLFFCEDLR